MFSEIEVVISWFFEDVLVDFFYDFLANNEWAIFAFMVPICFAIIMAFVCGILRVSTLRMPQTRIHNFVNEPKFPVQIRQSKDIRMTERQTAVVDPVTGELHMRKSYTKTRKLTRKERKTADELMFDN